MDLVVNKNFESLKCNEKKSSARVAFGNSISAKHQQSNSLAYSKLLTYQTSIGKAHINLNKNKEVSFGATFWKTVGTAAVAGAGTGAGIGAHVDAGTAGGTLGAGTALGTLLGGVAGAGAGTLTELQKILQIKERPAFWTC